MIKKMLSIIMVLLLSGAVMTGCAANQSQTRPAPTPQSQPQNAVDTSNFIGEDRAREIALERAGITSDGVIFDRVELDFDNGVWEYEVEFRQGRNEYDANINAEDGTIILFETDYDD